MILKLNELMEELMKSPPSKISSDDMSQISGTNPGAHASVFYSYALNCIIYLNFYRVLVGHAYLEQIDAEVFYIFLIIQNFADGIFYFEGLMKDDQISSNLLILENDYSEWYCTRGELDERMFINGEDSLIGAVSSGSTPSVSGVKVTLYCFSHCHMVI